MSRLTLLLLCLLGFSACEEAAQSTVPLLEVKELRFDIVIPGFGELEAANAETISTPGRRPMVIDWLAEENSLVKKGDVVARFDSEQLALDSRKEELEMMLLDKDMRQKNAEKTQQESDLDSEKVFVSKEFEFVDAFAIDDLRLYSKLEIIETLSNRDYLGAKEEFIGWKQGSIGERIQSSVEVLDIRKSGHEAKFQQHQDALARLEVVAPYDGQLVYQKNWRGEKPSIGQTVFPGSTIAKIPNLAVMQAKVYILDKNAIGLKQGQPVKVTLEARPDITIGGNIDSVSGFSRTIKRGDPTKYFELVVSLDRSDENLQPGSKVRVKVEAQAEQNKIAIPLQAIFNDEGESFVYLKDGNGFVRKNIKTSQKNLYLVEISEGLSVGDVIALSLPENVS